MNKNDFHTLKGYERIEDKRITYAMEDYLEMICRICEVQEHTRMSELSQKLNVMPSSVTKMVNNLKAASLVDFEKYHFIQPTASGKTLGAYLIFRHHTVHRLLCLINHSENELEQVEKIEHFLDTRTVKNIELFLNQQNPQEV